MQKILLALSVILSFHLSQAQEIKGVFSLGAEFGGDSILSIRYADGSTSTLKGGNGGLLAGGILYNYSEVFSAQATLGIKYTQTAEATNQTTTFMRFPLEALGFYTVDSIHARFGGGLSYHISPKIDASGALVNGTVNFDPSLGFILQGDYIHEQKMFFGLRYTSMKYKTGSISVDGSSFGFQLAFSN